VGEGACVWVVGACKTCLGSGSVLECWEDKFFETWTGEWGELQKNRCLTVRV
jgi:hypothetical protein